MPEGTSSSGSTNSIITVGTSRTGNIDSVGDEDWWRVSLVPGKYYTIRLVGLGTGSNTLPDPLIQGIFLSNDNYAGGYNNDGLISGPNGKDAMVLFRGTGTGTTAITHWIGVAGDRRTTGSYTLSVTDSTGGNDGAVTATTATSAAVTVGATTTGTIDTAGDVDWIKVSLDAGTVYRISIRGIVGGGGTLADPILAGVYDANGTYINHTYIDDVDTRDAVLAFSASYTGFHYIAAKGFSSYVGSYTVGVNAITTEVPASTGSTATLALGVTGVQVSIDQPYDRDWYKVWFDAGTTYQISLTGTGSNNMPGIWGIYDANGVYRDGYAVALNYGTSTSAKTIFTPTASGYYFIDAYSIYEGTYTLTAVTSTADVPASTSSATTVTPGTPVTGDIGSSTDVDWYRVSLTGGISYTIRMEGTRGSNGMTLVDTLISGVYTATGGLIANTYSDDKDGSDAVLTFRPPTAGTNTYFIAAEGYGNYIGSFRLSVTQLTGDVGHTKDTYAALTLGTEVAGTVDDASDSDWYGWTVTAGKSYYIRARGLPSGNGTLTDPLLYGLYDSAGALIPNTMSDDIRGSRDAAIIYTVPTGLSGMHFAGVEGYDSATGTYKILAVGEDNVVPAAATAWAVPNNQSATGTIDTSTDLDWYRFGLDNDTSYIFRMYGSDTGNGTLTAPYIARLLNNAATPTAQTVDRSSDGATSIIRYATAAAGGGDYFVEMKSNDSGVGTFKVTMEVEPGATMGSSELLSLGIAATGTIDDAADVDWYAVPLTQNTSYVFKMLGSRIPSNGTLADPRIVEIRTNATTVLTTGNDNATGYGNDSYLRYNFTGTSGTYYIVARGANSTIGTFTISAEQEPGSANASAMITTVGAVERQAVDDTTDTDWFAIDLTAGFSYAIKMRGDEQEGGIYGTLNDPHVATITNPSATSTNYANNTSVGYARDAVIVYSAGTTGTYYIKTAVANSSIGTYTFSVEQEAGITTASSISVAEDTSVNGWIDVGNDVDWYSVPVTSGVTYVFKLEGADSSNGSLADPWIDGVRASTSTTILQAATAATNDAVGKDSIIRYVAGATNPVYVHVKSQTTTTVGSYRFSVEIDATGATTGTATAVDVGSPFNGRIEDPGDLDYYAIALTAGRTYEINLTGVDNVGGTLEDPNLVNLLNAGGGIIAGTAVNDTIGRDPQLVYTPDSTGTFYIVAGSIASKMGTYTLTVVDITPEPQQQALSLVGVSEAAEAFW